MFYRNENGRLGFERLNFEIFIADAIESIEPDNMSDLKWMVCKMIESVQQVAWEYVCDNDSFEEEWEDVFYPADMY